MDFSADKNLSFQQAVEIMFEKLGTSKIMALATAYGDSPMVRNVSCLFYDEAIWFKTDMNFRKTAHLLRNPRVAMCWNGIQVEGIAENRGLVVDEPGRRFEELYKKHLWGSYNKYSHEDSEILIKVKPCFVEVWDTSEENYAFQIFIDFENESVEVKQYDQR